MLNLLIVGLLLIGFVIVAPNGIVGWCRTGRARGRSHDRAPAAGRQLSKRFGGFVALDTVDLSVAEGERVGLIGPNGSGKSTLVNCICGTLHNETGSVTFAGKTMDGLIAHERTRRGLARSFQLPRPFTSMSVAENIRVPLLYTVAARAGHHVSRPRPRSLHGVAQAGGARPQGGKIRAT